MNDESLFHRAVELSAAERAAFLAEACAGDAALRQRLELLLQAHAQPGSFLQERAVTLPAEMPAASATAEAAGTRIGPYKLIEPIGEGGMGSVWRAEQLEPVRRQVALKLIKEGLDSARVIARFEAERQALALMDHPNIAKVFDAGTTESGRPYFVMELVKGVAITNYCDEQRLTPRQRLELFIPICQAVQHAHQKGIIHRDLKPSNVLIALYDGQRVPKVIDFGIAKATGDPLTERTLHTGFGAIVGTLEYMSPEQAEPNQLDIDTRSDVYSLGVMLYELLAGSTPLDRKRLQHAAIWELLRVIREEEPPNPSMRLSSSESLTILSVQRQMEPAKLARLVRGELDWIVMKALEKDRARRYGSAAGLGLDIERYLKDEPVEASPPSALYRLRKFAKRHRGPVVAASLVLLTLLAGVVGTTVGMVRAQDAEKEASDARDTIQANLLVVESLHKKEAQARAQAVDEKQRAEANEHKAKENERKATFQALRAETARHAIQIDLIVRAWQQHDLFAATAALNEVPETFRQTWEYRYLRDLCRRTALPLYAPNGGAHRQFSPDGKTFAVGGVGVIKIWDAETGQQKSTLTIDGSTYALAFSRDSKRIVITRSSEPGMMLQVLDVATGQERLSVKLGTTYSWDAAFSADGKRLVTTSVGGVLVLDATTGKEKLRIKESSIVDRVSFSSDGKRLVVAGSGVGVKIYDAGTGKAKRTLSHESNTAKVVSFSPDGKRLLLLRSNNTAQVWDTETGLETLKGIQGLNAEDAGFTEDGKAIVLVSGHSVKALDVETGLELPLPQPTRSTCGSLSPDGQRVAVESGGVILLWSVGVTTPVRFQLSGYDDAGLGRRHSRGFTPDGKHIYSWEAIGALTFFSAETGQKQHSFKLLTGQPDRISADGKRLARSEPGHVKIFETETGQELLAIKQPSEPMRVVAFSADGQRLVCTCVPGLVKVWNIKTGQEELSLAMENKAHATIAALAPDGSQIAAGSFHGEVTIWDAWTGKKTMAFRAHKENVEQIVFIPDGKRLLTYDGEVGKVWDIQTGQEQAVLHLGGGIWPIVFTPDATRIVRGYKMWDVATGQLVFAFPEFLCAIAISPDGQRIMGDNASILVAP